MITKRQFLHILRNYRKGKATEQEKALLDAYYNLFEAEQDVLELMQPDERLAIRSEIESQISEKIAKLENKPAYKNGNYLWKAGVAASIMLILSFGTYFILKNRQGKVDSEIAIDVNPGGDKAILTLSDGTKIGLDNSKNGLLVSQANIKISKTADGKLIYNALSGQDAGQISYHTLETPAGGQFQLILPDGSHAWLNAKSSIRYPTAFLGDERKVEITGEVYFEVVANKQKPFRVLANRQLTEVLGTHFNINAYPDEQTINTTLLEGLVKVSETNGNHMALLKPGQQSRFIEGSNFKVISNVDLQQVIAWKNGFFEFDDTDLQAVMRQLARWYDVEVDVSHLPQKEFDGVISRKVALSKVLKMLELTSKLQFKIAPINEKTERRMIMLK